MAQTFIATGRVVLAGNGTGTFVYSVGSKERFEIKRIIQTATGAFSITGIRDAHGNNYDNSSPTNPILSSWLASGANPNNNLGDFPEPIVIQGGGTIYIDLLDTSTAGNTVDIGLIGTRHYD